MPDVAMCKMGSCQSPEPGVSTGGGQIVSKKCTCQLGLIVNSYSSTPNDVKIYNNWFYSWTVEQTDLCLQKQKK